MKIHKGEAGYIRVQKKKLAIQTVLSFALVAALIITGYLLTVSYTHLTLPTILRV